MAEIQRPTDSLAYVTPQSDGQPDAWSKEAGMRGGQRLLEVTETAPPGAVAQALRLPAGQPTIIRRRLILMDGAPVELADSYYPLAVAQGTPLAEARKIKGGAPTLLAELGYRARHVSEDLELREADEAERRTLNLPAGANVLGLLRTTSTEDGSPFEVQLMVMKAPRRLHYEIEVD